MRKLESKKKINKSAKGNYYRLKTKKFFESEGYAVGNIEETKRIYNKEKDQVFFVKKDLWGGDLVAANKKELLWIQVKTNKSHINSGLKELEKNPLPDFVQKIVVFWEPKQKVPDIFRLKKE